MTSQQKRTTVGEQALQKLRGSLRGEVLLPGDARYDDARRIWNGMIDKHPALIARCAGTADVIESVRFAREHDLVVSARGGGHNIAGNCVCEDGLMIDLSPMKGIRVEPGRRIARAEPGVKLGEFDLETQAFGLATPLGVATDTGIAGLNLGGGYGWLAGKYGLSCDNLVSADVVTANGTMVTASAGENADLFWGLRGGGGNFGIVTSFEYRLHEVGTVLGGPVFYPLDQARTVLHFYNEFVRTMPDELSTVAGFLTTPDGQISLAIGVCWCGDLSAGEKILQPVRRIASPKFDLIQPMPYRAMQSIFDPMFLPGRQYYWKSSLLRNLSDAAIDVLTVRGSRLPTPFSVVILQGLSGAAARVAPTATAFAHRYNHWNCVVHSGWTDGDAASNISWVRDTWSAAERFLERAVYMNDLGEEEAGRVLDAYGSNHQRLAELKKKYDPTNFFSLNQNIKPAA